MPRTISIKVFEFDELNDKAKETARVWMREDYPLGDWWESVFEDAKACFGLLGFSIKDIHFTGFSSQGDGACFDGTWRACNVRPSEVQKYAPKDEKLHRIAAGIEAIAKQYPGLSFRVSHSGQYSHKYMTSFEVENHDIEDDVIDHPAEVEKEIIELARDAMQWIYDTLQTEYEYQTADAQIDETLRINEYLFTEDGKRCAVL